jgi:5-methylcytosine-specific restriction enzyme subunit McrC
MNIPILNLFYLLCYAWDILPSDSLIESGIEEIEAWPDLLSFILIRGVERLLRRGLEREYNQIIESSYSIRGKIRITDSITEIGLHTGKLNCEFDELQEDTLINIILRSTLRSLFLSQQVRKDLQEQLAALYARMNPVSVINLQKSDFHRIRYHRNNPLYKFLISICELVYNAKSVKENDSSLQFENFIKDERKMRRLFESFIRNFLRKEITTFSEISAKTLNWGGIPRNSESSKVLPRMLTDIFLQSEAGIIIIECKFTPNLLALHLGNEKLRSSHLYQIYSYLEHSLAIYQPQKLKGILLYPTVDREHLYDYQFPKFNLSIMTINLNKPWKEIHNSLLELVTLG